MIPNLSVSFGKTENHILVVVEKMIQPQMQLVQQKLKLFFHFRLDK